jgi:predicted 3-demethylubiquinone-9 3-methyltransferase (glyoxalase superfamily)
MQKVHPFLWFVDQAEEAANYYVGTFKNSKINSVTRYPGVGEEITGHKEGQVMTVEFELDGTSFTALNGGKVPGFEFSPATSFVITCEDQAEIDHYWEKLSAVPEAEQCGWCTDKFGVTWQVVPKQLGELLSDPAKTDRVTSAFLKMKKFDIAELEKAGA